VLQGDGIDYRNIQQILEAVLAAGYSAEAVAFGMGGGLLQKVNRDTLSLAAKLSHVVYADGSGGRAGASAWC
jgi:nicotinic acid phosphoribosyltransferase